MSIELKRIKGTCCPEPTCDYDRPTFSCCEECGFSCSQCNKIIKKYKKTE